MKHATDLVRRVGNVLIPVSDGLIVFGSYVSSDNHETPASRHHIAKGWSCSHKWEHVPTLRSPLPAKIRFRARVVLPYLLWACRLSGLRTLRVFLLCVSARS